MSKAPEKCEIIIGDITKQKDVERSFKDIDFCFHLAAVSSVQLSNEDWKGTHEINQTGSINIFEAARKNSIPVVYASSAAVYGDNADMPQGKILHRHILASFQYFLIKSNTKKQLLFMAMVSKLEILYM
jgi:nucleoside-diphosphate-sugar epimerase